MQSICNPVRDITKAVLYGVANSRFEYCERLRDCRYGELFEDIVNYRQFDECKHMRVIAGIAS